MNHLADRSLRLAQILSHQSPLVSRGSHLRMPLTPEYSLVASRQRVAIKPGTYNQAMGKFNSYDLPFDNMLGESATRIVLPYENEVKSKLSQALGKDGELGENGYDRIDWEKGEAIKIIPVDPKAPPGSKPKERRTSLGKAIGRLTNSKEVLNWWSGNKDSAKRDDYSIIVSRHPVDVVRMSDHKDIESCHSPGAGEWQSCLNEMQYGGLVTYLVKNEDIQKLTPEQLAGKDEIFYDKDRGIDGIRPVSRLRVRRFTHIRDDFDLAVPEEGVYGQDNSEFLRQVVDWTRDSQKDLLEKKRWRMDEFARRGGKYEDTSDSTLFNNLFGDNLDRGSAQYGLYDEPDDDDYDGDGDDDEDYDDNDEMETENNRQRDLIHEHDQANNFEHCSVSYEEEYNDDGEIYFTWTGNATVSLPAHMFGKDIFPSIDKKLNAGNESLTTYLGTNGFAVGGGNIYMNPFGGGTVHFNITVDDPDGGSGDSDGYETYCHLLRDDFEAEYDRLRSVVVQWLLSHNFVQPTPVRQFEYNAPQLENFDVEVGSGMLDAYAEDYIGPFDQALWSESQLRGAANYQIRNLVAEELDRIIHRKKNPPAYLPGMQPESPPVVKEHYNLNNFDVYLSRSETYKPQVVLGIQFSANDVTSQEYMQEISELMVLVDRMFPKIVIQCKQLLENFYKQREKYFDEPGDQPFQFDPDTEYGSYV